MEGFKSFVSGGIGGMTLTLVGYPLDTIKVQLQTAEAGKFKGTMDCAKQTMARDGFFVRVVGYSLFGACLAATNGPSLPVCVLEPPVAPPAERPASPANCAAQRFLIAAPLV